MRKALFFFLLLLFGSLFFPSFTLGLVGECYNGKCEPADYVEDCWEVDCKPGNSCYSGNCPQPQPANVCCRPGVSCPEGKPTWTYAYNANCVVDVAYDYGPTCSWHWQFQYCGAGDKCSPCSNGGGGEAICAGICADAGCDTGGWYKTCCVVAGPATVGARLTGVTGSCTSGGGCSSPSTRVRWAGFGSPGPACSNSLCLQSYDGYSWVVGTCGSDPAPTVPPGGGGSEPPPDSGGRGDCGQGLWQGDCSCGAGKCEVVSWGMYPDGNCSPCYNKHWDQGCPHGDPRSPRLYSPVNGVQTTGTTIPFSWYRFSSEVEGCSSSCWGWNCYTWQYTIYPENRIYELFITQRPNVPSPESKNPGDWGGPVLRVWGDPDTLASGERSGLSTYIARNVDFSSKQPGTYYWFLRARNGWDFSTGYDGVKDSAMGSFNYCAPVPPNQPTCTYPNNESVADSTAILQWTAPSSWGAGCPDSKSYQIYLDASGGAYPPTSQVCSVGSGTTQCTVNGLEFSQSYFWRVKATNNTIFSYSNTCSFIVKEPGPWWQTTDGDIHAQGTITSLIPGCSTTSEYLSNDGDGGSPGVVTWGGGTSPSLEKGTASSTNWQANDANRRTRIGYDYLANRLNLDKSKVYGGDLAGTDSGTYYLSDTGGTYSFNGGDVGTKKIIVFSEGEVKVTGEITVSEGGFFALITKERLTFDATVARAEGFYLADSVIDTSFAKTGFAGYGSFIGWGGFNLQRDLSNGTTGGCTPSETFFARPDLYINAPKEFLITPSFFQEMAP